MRRGVVIGKFFPPHRGHKFLIDTALSQVDHFDVLICVHPEQNISGGLREQWLKEIHPSAHVRQIEDFGDDDNSERWATYTISILGYLPDVVFSSENYGEPYARFMGCRHVMVDRERLQVPISARAIRARPLRYWEFMEPCVRAYFVKRVCVVGAESTGTTTLAQDLAAHYQTVWVPEYGREYCEKMQAAGVDLWNYQWRTEEFVKIALAQQEHEDRLACDANRVLFCDTDALATCIWHERYLGSKSSQVEQISSARRYNFYFLTDSDIPFVQDGVRDGENIRQWMTGRFAEELGLRNVAWRKLSGSREERLARAIEVVDGLLL